MTLQPIGLDATITGVPDFTGGIDKMNRAVDSFADNSTKQGGMFSGGFGEIVTGALRKIGELGIQALLKAGQAVAGFVKDSIGLAGDFEAGMNEFRAVAGSDIDASGLEQFHDLFIQLGKDLPVSTSEVQQAAIELIKGGIEPATVAAGGLESSIQFAAAAMKGDLVGAAEISAKIVGGWAEVGATAAQKAELLAHSQDVLTKTSNAATVGVDDLALGLFNVQGNAKLAGIGFDDLTTTLALIAPNFSSASTAGTSLNAMIARLQPTTDPAIVAMTRLGLYTQETGSAFYDAQGNFIGWAATSQLLQDATKGLTDAQKQSTFQTIFGMDAQGAAAELTRQGAAGWDLMADKIDKANGVAENAAIKQEGFNTALKNAQGSVEAFQIQLGEHLLPLLTDLLDNAIVPAINDFSNWSSAILSADDPIQALIKSIDDLLPGFQSFVDTSIAVGTFVGDNLTPILAALAAVVVGAVVPALATATVAFIGVAAPIAAIGVAVALLAKAWETDFLGIKTTVTQVWNDTLLPAFQDIQSWLTEKIPPAIKTMASFWTNTLQPALAEVWGFLQSKVFPVLSDLVGIYIAAAIIEVKALAALWTNVLQPALKVVWDFISGSVIPIFKALFEVNWAIASKAVEAMAGLWQKVLQPAFKAVGDYITTTVVPALTSVGSYLSATLGPILTSAKQWLDSVTGGFGGVTSAVKDVVTWLGNLATSISNLKLPDWLTPGSPTPFETALVGIGTALQKSVAPGLATMRQGMKDIGTEITGAFQDTDFADMLSGLGEDAMLGFGQGLKDGMRGVINVINSTANTVEGAFNDAFGAHSPATLMMPVGENVIQGIMVGLTNLLPSLTELIEQTGGNMIDALKKNISKGGDEIRAMMADLTAEVKDIASQINDAIADGFGATASIDRQIAKNLDKFKDIPDKYKQYTEGALKEAQTVAAGFADPTQGAKFFKMRSDQILEFAKLQQDMAEAETQEDADRIQQQMILINAAQTKEIQQWEALQAAMTTPMQDIAAQIQALFQSNELAGQLPGILENQIIAQLTSLMHQLQSPPGVTRTPYNPNAVSTTNTTTLNMPIYTNQSPGVLQDSMAIAGAALL